MKAHTLSALGAGFSNEALGSQAVFRAVLQALSQPGKPVRVDHDAQVPAVGHSAAAAALLALLDSDCSLWLSPRLATSNAGQWLRFHTGCQLVNLPEQARFVWVAAGDAMPPLHALALGSDAYPDQSATCVLDVDAMDADAVAHGAWRLRGPGIRDVQHLRVSGLPADFERQWADNHVAFPRGVDVLLATANHLAGLPRTTRIPSAVEA
ncbi:phosphonate C-P lyase system protein PhnH [Acidovorax carolinensis]|uniref:Phosphonate C-P lyase system protein PhnH n=1 Tax=Acidovorax carolinensis TaxID=553814 RepID=A0A240U9X5_9BURK|nr:phosphonate C-P lyase system protein PhnH [Acidovorax carolinensis]ART56205.1 phosphonate C-P lyase system protein PhnH [Acidovorax carolinensis]ART57852.1 phosphonate C-P lyase system protein PhnH [Acidovorax carolinensis]